MWQLLKNCVVNKYSCYTVEVKTFLQLETVVEKRPNKTWFYLCKHEKQSAEIRGRFKPKISKPGGGRAHQYLDILSCKTSTTYKLWILRYLIWFHLVVRFCFMTGHILAYFISTRNINYISDWRHLIPERLYKQIIIGVAAICFVFFASSV